ncbi:MAG: hypothetical protein UFG06_13915 [Lachnospiraceae bacterium]|nr:hypothetical protein [Lachnospiraceae bacterium]
MRDIKLCEMCTEYSKDIKCENKDNCKLLAIVRENRTLKKENADLRLEMSYMVNPNAIGDRHEMGCW